MSNAAAIPDSASRTAWIDAAKGIGISLVFYGHLVERFIETGAPAAAAQMKWIYSFHMPLFFVLAGLVYKDRQLGWTAFAKRELLTRLVPAWAFNVIGMLAWVRAQLAAADFGYLGEHGWAGLAQYCAATTLYETAVGLPRFNVLMWFLICLVVVEAWHYCLRPLVRSTVGLALSVVLFVLATVLVATYRQQLDSVVGSWVNWWHFTSAVAAMAFYQLGILLQRLGGVRRAKPAVWENLAGLGCLIVTLLTFSLNHPSGNRVVMLAGGEYGSPGWFFLTSLAGILFVFNLSRALAGLRWLTYLGRITLALMCLDGILHDFVNPGLVAFVAGLVPVRSVGLTTALCTIGTAFSLGVCLPVVWILQRYGPFLIGQLSHVSSWRQAKPAI
jgi:acyltransferase